MKNGSIGFDTNVLIRTLIATEPEHLLCVRATNAARAAGSRVVLGEASLREVYRMATGHRNGLGLPSTEAMVLVRRLESRFEVLPQTPEVQRRWSEIVVAESVPGVRTYDAYLVATLLAHGVESIVTMDAKFRFASIDVLSPADLLAAFGAVRQEDRERDPDQ